MLVDWICLSNAVFFNLGSAKYLKLMLGDLGLMIELLRLC